MSFSCVHEALDARMRRVPDFPLPGVLFEDLTPVLADAEAFALVVDTLAERVKECGADLIAGLDARGFLLGSAVAYRLGLGILAIRKAGKLPPPVFSQEYALEYGTEALEVPHDDSLVRDKRIVLVDDVLATGGTLSAAASLLERAGAVVTGCAVVLEVPGLGGREAVGDTPLIVVGNDESNACPNV